MRRKRRRPPPLLLLQLLLLFHTHRWNKRIGGIGSDDAPSKRDFAFVQHTTRQHANAEVGRRDAWYSDLLKIVKHSEELRSQHLVYETQCSDVGYCRLLNRDRIPPIMGMLDRWRSAAKVIKPEDI